MMRVNIRSVVKAVAIVVVLGVLGILAYLQHPFSGKLPQGGRLARIAQSHNYADGVFRNQMLAERF